MRTPLSCVVLLAFAQVVGAQSPAPRAAAGPTLTLDEALSLAKKNNPLFLQARNGRTRAGAALRSARGAFVPSLSANLSGGYREGIPQFFGGVALGATSSTVSSNLQLNANLDLSPSVWMNSGQQRLAVAASESDVDNAGLQLRAFVVQQYMTALQQAARVRLQDTLLANTQAQLELTKAKQAAGSATDLDARRAEVQVGQQQVATLQARNQAEVEKLRLFQQLGVPQPGDVRLVTELPVGRIDLSLAQLLDEARRQNPVLRAYQAREEASGVAVRRQKFQYLPSLNLSAGVSGYTQKYVEGGYVGSLPAAQQPSVQAANDRFPFDFTRQPYTVGLSLNLPIFDGFGREGRVDLAEADRSDARYNTRAEELKLTADVTAAYLTIQTDLQSVDLNAKNALTAREALQLAEQRYRVGLSSIVEVIQARADFETAENSRINSVYQFHRDFATLESAVGRPLR